MKAISFVLILGLACYGLAYDIDISNEWDDIELEHNDTRSDRGLILNSQAKRVIRNFQYQMPCGFPEYGVPPLAPYTNADLQVRVQEAVAESLLEFLRFRFDGLDNMQIKKLKVSYTFSKRVKFHFNFRLLRLQAKTLNSDTIFDTLEQLGISVRYEGSGPFDFSLENLSVQGQFKYKMPFIFGSVKIYKFQAVLTIGAVRSHIGGILGNGAVNKLINDIIEFEVPLIINGNQKLISKKIENIFVPLVNERLKGHKVWYMIGLLFKSNRKCDPETPPW